MAITVKHKFNCTVPDDPDTTLVRPSNWNDTHDVTGLGSAAEHDAADFANAAHAHDWADISGEPAFLTAETDPVFAASPAAGITLSHLTNWNAAFSWGNHAAAGYLTSFVETDPVFAAAAAASITTTNISNWNSAYLWGNHSAVGYAVLAGQSGGQTFSGGTASGDGLTLSTTSHATKGKLRFGGSLYDEATNRLAINATIVSGSYTPANDLEIYSPTINYRPLKYNATNGQLLIGQNATAFSTQPGFYMNNGVFAFTGTPALLGSNANVINNFGNYTALLVKKGSPTGVGNYLVCQTSTAEDLFVLRSGGDFSLSGNAAKQIYADRNTTSNTAGNNLTLQSGGSTVGATDKNGGTLVLNGGIATGIGYSGVQIKTAQAGAAGTADRTPTTIIEALGNKLAFNGATPVTKPTVTGSRGGNAALASLLTALATLGLITDSTTA